MVGKVAILALQGAFAKHEEMLHNLGIETLRLRYASELSRCCGLIIPGGESTVMRQHILDRQLLHPLQQFAQTNPVFGTCAGMILMAREGILGLIDISVNRNAYGPQRASFSTRLNLTFTQHSTEALFIRAPRITALHSPEVNVLASLDSDPVLVQQGRHLAASFHPELTDDSTIHRYFIQLCQGERREVIHSFPILT